MNKLCLSRISCKIPSGRGQKLPWREGVGGGERFKWGRRISFSLNQQNGILITDGFGF